LRRTALPHALFSVWLPGLLALSLAGCNAGYSPNTYASTAAQEEAAVQRGMIIGVRQVRISASGAIGTVTGGAAGGVAGAQVSSGTVGTALGAIGGTLVGGIGGTAAAQAMADAKGWEYIVQEDGNKLVSVTQTSKTALALGLHVLVISDAQQARIVPDYTVQIPAAPANGPVKTAVAPNGSAAVEIHIGPLLPDPAQPLQVAPAPVASDPAAPEPAAAAPAVAAPAAVAPAAAPASAPAAAAPPAGAGK